MPRFGKGISNYIEQGRTQVGEMDFLLQEKTRFFLSDKNNV